jgi:hypothetical protein
MREHVRRIDAGVDIPTLPAKTCTPTGAAYSRRGLRCDCVVYRVDQLNKPSPVHRVAAWESPTIRTALRECVA